MVLHLILALAVIIAVTAVAIGALLFVRRTAPDGGYFNDGDRAAGFFGVLATGFAVLLGFIVFLAFDSYDESRSGAETEAQLIAQQYETAQFFPEATGPQLAADLICYGRYVVHREWPAMQAGTHNERVNPWGLAMFRSLDQTDPETSSEQAAFSKWMDQNSERQVARLDRIQGADGVIPWPLWLVMIGSAAIIFVYMLFFADSGERALVQAVQIGTVIAVITATLLLIRLLENPHQSGIHVLQPTAMERTLGLLESDLAGVGQQADLPCNAEGDQLAP